MYDYDPGDPYEYRASLLKDEYEEIRGDVDALENRNTWQAKIISEPTEVVWDNNVAIDSNINLFGFELTTPLITAFKVRAISSNLNNAETPDDVRALPIDLSPRKVDMHMTIPWVGSNNDPSPGLQVGDIVEIRYEDDTYTTAHATGLIKKTENPGIVAPWSTDASLVDKFIEAASAATTWGTAAFSTLGMFMPTGYDINMAAQSADVNLANVIDPASMSGFLTGWESKYIDSTDMMKEYLKILDRTAAAMQTEIRITSMFRSDYDQARIMFNNYISNAGGDAGRGRSYIMSLYSRFANIDQIIAHYEALLLGGVTSPDTTNMAPVAAIIAASWSHSGGNHLSGNALDAVPWTAEVSAVFAATQKVVTVSVLDEKNHFHVAIKSLVAEEGQTIDSFQGSVAPTTQSSTSPIDSSASD